MKKILCCILALTAFSAVLLCGCSKSGSGTVKVKLQAASLTGEELSDLDKFARDNGFDYATYNRLNGTVTVGIAESDHHNLLFSLGVTVIRNIFGMIGSEEYPYIKNVERSSDFRSITILADKDECEKAGKQEEIVDYAGNCCLVYLRYTDESEKEKTCLISLRDEKTGEILTEKTFNVKDMENADR